MQTGPRSPFLSRPIAAARSRSCRRASPRGNSATAWDDGAAIRVVLLFEVWRPELAEEERQALTTLYRSINLYGADT